MATAPTIQADTTNRLLYDAPAKVNLYLGVHPGADKDGYHTVDTVMVAVSLFDRIAVEPSPALAVATTPEIPGTPETNTMWRAASLLGAELGISPLLRFTAEKRIPWQKGLGGGSTDAAAALLALQTLWQVEDEAVIQNEARTVGADVPFFLKGRPALYSNRGDVEVKEYGFSGWPVVLVAPRSLGISTPQAYRDFDRSPAPLPPFKDLDRALEAGDREKVGALMANNLMPAVEAAEVALYPIRQWLSAREGVLGCVLTGSGSAYAALMDTMAHAEAVAYDAREMDWWASAAETLEQGPVLVDRVGFC